MKKIGLTQRLDSEKDYNETRTALDIRWYELLLSNDLLPVPIPMNFSTKQIIEMDIEGFIFTGGNDLFSQSRNDLSKIRDKFETECINYAIRNSIPILGVCRGMQLVAEYFGSTLKKVNGHVAVRHKVRSAIISEVMGELDLIREVNSYHNYSIDTLGEDLFKIAVCPDDNVIEAIEHKNHKIFCQMWHPEREDPYHEMDNNIISNVFYD